VEFIKLIKILFREKKSYHVILVPTGTSNPSKQFSLSQNFIHTLKRSSLVVAGVIAFFLLASIYTVFQFSSYRRAVKENTAYKTSVSTLNQELSQIREKQNRIVEFAKKLESITAIGSDIQKLGTGALTEKEYKLMEDQKANKRIDPFSATATRPLESQPNNIGLKPTLQNSKAAKTQASVIFLQSVVKSARELNEESEKVLRQLSAFHDSLERERESLESLPTVSPVQGWLTSGFGSRVSPFTGEVQFHEGLDISNNQGTPIVAPASGRVIKVSRDSGMGLFIEIDHGNGIQTRYGHLLDAYVDPGEKVLRHQVIAEMGNTGRSTGPHLHYEIIVSGRMVNPKNFIFDEL
jgi:murein DD-endopeptidase MepM/ murein hydrolase activator NlpD